MKIDLSPLRHAISFDQCASIEQAVDASAMTIRVDIVDRAATSPAFQNIILKNKVIV